MIASYEDRLRTDRAFARRELEACFGAEGRIFCVLRRLWEEVSGLGVRFALCGDFAMCEHGCFEATPKVEILACRDDLPLLRSMLKTFGFHNSGNRHMLMVDSVSPVTIQFQIARSADSIQAIEFDGVPILSLPRLIEMKLSGAVSDRRRLKDVVDVQELIRACKLDRAAADELDPSVQLTFLELCDEIQVMPA